MPPGFEAGAMQGIDRIRDACAALGSSDTFPCAKVTES